MWSTHLSPVLYLGEVFLDSKIVLVMDNLWEQPRLFNVRFGDMSSDIQPVRTCFKAQAGGGFETKTEGNVFVLLKPLTTQRNRRSNPWRILILYRDSVYQGYQWFCDGHWWTIRLAVPDYISAQWSWNTRLVKNTSQFQTLVPCLPLIISQYGHTHFCKLRPMNKVWCCLKCLTWSLHCFVVPQK